MRFLLATAAAIALAAPATAQTIFPASAALTFCNLRALGVSRPEAVKAAVNENYSSERPYMIQHNGTPTDTNALLMVSYITKRCPQYVE